MKKHDISTAFGLICGFLVIMESAVWGQTNPSTILKSLKLFWDVPSIFIVIGGSLCAIVVSFEWKTVRSVPSILKNAFLQKQMSKKELVKLFIKLSDQSKRSGVLSLESSLDGIHDPYLKSGLQMAIDGFDEASIRKIQTLKIEKMTERHKNCIQLFRLWANLAPSFGMLGTFMGLIEMMDNFTDLSRFGSAFATVLVTSFYGVILANLVFTPLANKLDIKNSAEVNRMEMILEGVVGISAEVNPRVMEDKLIAFLSPSERLEFELVDIKSIQGTKDGKADKNVA
ncbi:MAG TPA: motility protein A [Ruminococcaceae bacterium]|nr:motility protein A [Oscillospiraceae bacterium]